MKKKSYYLNEIKDADKISDKEEYYLNGSLIDSEGNIYEWISTDKPYELMLPNGEYTLREIEAPEGYEIAEDQTFTVEIVIDVGYHANTVNPNVPCETATTYYVEIDGKKHEVYCIN